ncbi:MAG TPA: tRNA (adenosine(37)-N6)-dimethylallyltransferase MiaA [Burkholderiaceae bacterium]|nr:tRNA (adenosine(37)-N6)-dimethylallyltransferase MiaA [Burkholderiaceae bacterium]
MANTEQSPLPPLLPRYIALAGPTASGKTAAALAIATHLQAKIPVEIISVDSALVYRGMDIGTAKPTAAELGAVPHHLIDIRDPLQAYSAAEFAKDATALIHSITARGHLPVLVGGTMLYFKALWEGLDDMPAANPAIRAALEREAAAVGWPAMHRQLAMVDPISAARLQPTDAQRIQRALEVYRITSKPLSAFHGKRIATDFIASQAINTPTTAIKLQQNPLTISLEPQQRSWLHERIAQRFDAMLAGGFEAEVRRLRVRTGLTVTTPAIRCVGYRQMWEALDSVNDGILDAATLQSLRDKGIAATRQLCKRQLTWLRSMPQRHIIACDAPDSLAQVLQAVDTWVQSHSPI